MSVYFCDTSALAKRYFLEFGTNWIRAITDPRANHLIVVAEITMVEGAAAIAAKHRAPSGITLLERDAAVNLLLHHCDVEYELVTINRAILDRAVLLTQGHRLRGYDAVQLATALLVNSQYLSSGLPSITLLSADRDLLDAARREGLTVDDPNTHP